jgi:hypothetical protein
MNELLAYFVDNSWLNIRISTYIKERYFEKDNRKLIISSFLITFFKIALITAITAPLKTLALRMQQDAAVYPEVQTGFMGAIKYGLQLVGKEGVKTFYRGYLADCITYLGRHFISLGIGY